MVRFRMTAYAMLTFVCISGPRIRVLIRAAVRSIAEIVGVIMDMLSEQLYFGI